VLFSLGLTEPLAETLTDPLISEETDGDTESLTESEPLPELLNEPVSLYVFVAPVENEPVELRVSLLLKVPVVETVRVTPVGNVVILGVPLFTTLLVKLRVIVGLSEAETDTEGLEDLVFVATVVRVTVQVDFTDCVPRIVEVIVVVAVEDFDLLADAVYDAVDVLVLVLLAEPVIVGVPVLLFDLKLLAEDDVVNVFNPELVAE